MLRRIQMQRVMWPLLAGVLAIAACSSAIACALFPQKTRNTGHCAEKAADSDSQHTVNRETVTALTEQTDRCSHCVTHSPGQTSSSSRAVVANSASQDSVTADFRVLAVSFSSPNSLIEIHDHGPPGSRSPRYVLNQTFRI